WASPPADLSPPGPGRIEPVTVSRLLTFRMTYPPLMRRNGFETFTRTLPATELVRQWGERSVAKIGGRIYAVLAADPGELWFKVSPVSFEVMTELPGIRPAPYLARAGWVAVSAASPLDNDELEAYLRAAHQIIAAKLTRKQRAELGL